MLKITNKVSNKAATTTDKLVGRNIRIHRLLKGLTQETLAAKLGITFQQIQKYEKGGNLVGSGRLFQIAEILGAPVTAFFDDEDKTGRNPSPFDLLGDPLTLRMTQEFSKLNDRKMRGAILAVVETLVRIR